MRIIERTLGRVARTLQEAHPDTDISQYVRGFTLECAKAALMVAPIEEPRFRLMVSKAEEFCKQGEFPQLKILSRASETSQRLAKDKWEKAKAAHRDAGVSEESDQEFLCKTHYWLTVACTSVHRLDAMAGAVDAINALVPLVKVVQNRRAAELVLAISSEKTILTTPWAMPDTDRRLQAAACNLVIPLMQYVRRLDKEGLRRSSLSWALEARERVGNLPDALHHGLEIAANAIAMGKEVVIPGPLMVEVEELEKRSEEETRQMRIARDEDDRLVRRWEELLFREWAISAVSGCLASTAELAGVKSCFSVYNLIVSQAKAKTWLPLFDYLHHLIA